VTSEFGGVISYPSRVWGRPRQKLNLVYFSQKFWLLMTIFFTKMMTENSDRKVQTMRVSRLCLTKVGERHPPLEKSGETTYVPPHVSSQFKHWTSQIRLCKRPASVQTLPASNSWSAAVMSVCPGGRYAEDESSTPMTLAPARQRVVKPPAAAISYTCSSRRAQQSSQTTPGSVIWWCTGQAGPWGQPGPA